MSVRESRLRTAAPLKAKLRGKSAAKRSAIRSAIRAAVRTAPRDTPRLALDSVPMSRQARPHHGLAGVNSSRVKIEKAMALLNQRSHTPLIDIIGYFRSVGLLGSEIHMRW